jgi:hypothetical protein
MTLPDDSSSPRTHASASVRVRSGRDVAYNLIDLDTGVLYLDTTPVACLDRRAHGGSRPDGSRPDGTPLGRAS